MNAPDIADLAGRAAQALRTQCEGQHAFAHLLMRELIENGAGEVAAEMSNEQFEGFREACRLEHGNPSEGYIHAKAIEYCALKRIGGAK
jgi:hypothetical protein